ncbi:unnamed protein product [Hapterophycus canaliculatus]
MGRINTKAKHRRPVSESAAPSRGQRKRALKKASLIKKIGLTQHIQRGKDEPKVSTLMTTEKRVKASPQIKASGFQRVSSNRGKKTLMKAEMGQISAAMASSSFQEDPFAAIQAHLRHRHMTNPPPPVDDTKVRKPGKVSSPSIGHHSGDKRGDVKQKPKPYKGRNAKMRTK